MRPRCLPFNARCRLFGSSSNQSGSFRGGVYPIVATPFRQDERESIDLDSFRRSIEFFLESGSCQGVTIAGVLGESNRLLDSERWQLIGCAKDVISASASAGNDFELCVGTSHSGTAATVALSQMASELGATCVMIAPSKDESAQPSDREIFELYQRVAIACPNLRIVLQDHPSSTGVHLSLELIHRIVTDIPAIRCIKLESLPTVTRMADLHQQYPNVWNQCTILTGLGALYAGYDLESDLTSGFMTGFAFPEVLHQMNQYAQNGEINLAQALYRKFLPLIVLEQTPGAGLALRKEIYKLRGWIECAHVRHPGKNISSTLQTILRAELERCLPGIDLTKFLSREVLFVE